MLRAILVSVCLLSGCVQNTPQNRFNQYTLHNVDYTIDTDNPDLTREIANKIYPMSQDIIKKWLDGPIPVGMRHITVNVHITPYRNQAWCTITDHPNIHIYSNREHLYETLKHELTHALLMVRYPDLPRWTHEGVASSWDGAGHQKMYLRILAWSRKSGTYPKLNEIMKGVRFDGSNPTAYTASNSLVKFLLHKRDRYTLFLYSTNKCTLKRAYGYSSIAELQEAWVKWLNEPVEAKKPKACPCCPEGPKAPPSTPKPSTD